METIECITRSARGQDDDERGFFVDAATAQPLNLSRASADCGYQSEAGQEEEHRFVYANAAGAGHASGSGSLDAHFRRAIDARTLRDLESMSQYLLQVPTSPSGIGMLDADGVEIAREEEVDYQDEQDQDPDPDLDQEEEPEQDEDNDGGVEEQEQQDGCDAGISLSGMNSETEVMRAARALFSKRTRTLYHWMYPDTPKMHLKAVVANAWDSMLTAEKQFYVSQVLGKFGCLQSQLMVNPQLGLFATAQNAPATPTQQMTLPQVPHAHAYMESPAAGQGQARHAPEHYAQFVQYAPGPIRRRRGRPRGSLHSRVLQQRYGDMPSIYAQRLHAVKRLAEGNLPLPIRRHPRAGGGGVARGALCNTVERVTCSTITENDFNDDPELRNEFEKFEWTMHMVE